MTNYRREALALWRAHTSGAAQVAINQIVQAVRDGDDDAALHWDRVFREIGTLQREAKLTPSDVEPVVCVPFSFLDLRRRDKDEAAN